MKPDTNQSEPLLPIYIWAVRIYSIIFICGLVALVVWIAYTKPEVMLYVLGASSRSDLAILVWAIFIVGCYNLKFSKDLRAEYLTNTPTGHGPRILERIFLIFSNIASIYFGLDAVLSG